MKGIITVEDCFYLGHISKIQGFKGDMVIYLDVDVPDEYSNLDSFFGEINNQLVPFFIEKISIQQKGYARIKLEGVDTEDAARALVGTSLYLPLEMLPDLDEDHFYFHEITGYLVIDKTTGVVGEVKEVIDLSGNPLLQIDRKGKEVLIPLNDNFLVGVNKKEKKIEVDLPEGLITLNDDEPPISL